MSLLQGFTATATRSIPAQVRKVAEIRERYFRRADDNSFDLNDMGVRAAASEVNAIYFPQLIPFATNFYDDE